MNRLAGILMTIVLLCAGCSSNVNQTAQNQQNDAAARREHDAYQTEIEDKLRELDQEIDQLREKIRQDQPDRAQLQEKLVKLEHKREVAHEKLERLKTSSQQAWSDMKAGIDAAVSDLDAAYHDAASRFK